MNYRKELSATEMNRRSFITSCSTLAGVGLAGCASTLTNSDPDAGALGFANNDDFPHVLSVVVTDGPDRVVGDGSGPTASVSLEPEESQTYDRFVTVPGMYELIAETDAKRSEPTAYKYGDDTDPAYVQAEIDTHGNPSVAVVYV